MIGTHSRTGLVNNLPGDAADRATRDATCPVALVRHRRIADKYNLHDNR